MNDIKDVISMIRDRLKKTGPKQCRGLQAYIRWRPARAAAVRIEHGVRRRWWYRRRYR